MVKVSIEVRSGSTRFRVAILAESFQRAVELAGERFPNRDARVSFPSVLDGLEHPTLKLAA